MMNSLKGKAGTRYELADSLRGVAAVLVVTGHLLVRDSELMKSSFFLHLLYCVHLPIFFFFAGFFSKKSFKKSLWTVTKQKAIRLLLPYLMWSSVAVLAKSVLDILHGEWILLSSAQMWIHTLLYADSMWFFLSLFLMHVLFRGLYEIWRKKPIVAICAAIVAYMLPMESVLSLHETQAMMPYFSLGLLAASYEGARARYDAYWKPMVIAAPVILLCAPMYVEIAYSNRMSYGLPMLLSACICTAVTSAFCVICKLLFNRFRVLSKAFSVLGKFSMEIYCVHMMFVNYLPIRIPQFLVEGPEWISDIAYFALAFTMGWIIVLLSHFVLNRIPIYRWFMLGQFPQQYKEKEIT